MHRYHPNKEADDPKDAILFDKCNRCSSHAENLFDLDRLNIIALWTRMIAVEVDGDQEYRTANEAKACRKLFTFYLLVERYGGIHPARLFLGE